MRLLRNIGPLLSTTLLIQPTSAFAQRIRSPIRADSLINGVWLRKPVRFEVHDIIAGHQSVLRFFKPLPPSRPSTAAYYRNVQDSVVLALRRPTQIAALSNLLMQEHTDQLRIILRDPHRSLLRWIYERGASILSYRFTDTVEVSVTQASPVCSLVTHVVSRTIRDELIREQNEISGETAIPIRFDSLFALLLTDQLDTFVSRMSPSGQTEECRRTLEFLKWVHGDSAGGFERGRYEIVGQVALALDYMAQTLQSMLKDWAHKEIEIVAAGYGDSVLVRDTGIVLNRFKTQVPEVMPQVMDVFYAGCTNDHLDSDTPVPVPTSPSTRVGQRIDNNCELGAVRGYVAARYIASKLRGANIHVRYATGGVTTASRNDARNRKVSLTLTLRSGRERGVMSSP